MLTWKYDEHFNLENILLKSLDLSFHFSQLGHLSALQCIVRFGMLQCKLNCHFLIINHCCPIKTF